MLTQGWEPPGAAESGDGVSLLQGSALCWVEHPGWSSISHIFLLHPWWPGDLVKTRSEPCLVSLTVSPKPTFQAGMCFPGSTSKPLHPHSTRGSAAGAAHGLLPRELFPDSCCSTGRESFQRGLANSTSAFPWSFPHSKLHGCSVLRV